MLGLLLSRIVRNGTLTLVHSNGRVETFGAGEPRATIRLHDARVPFEILGNPELKFGEAYMDGRLSADGGDLYVALDILMRNMEQADTPALLRALRRLRVLTKGFEQLNSARRARRNAAHHYDLSGRLYDLFLDSDKQYSCAYFSHPGESLEDAQAAKKRHVAAKLHLDRPGLKVLDIGSGWGGLALDLARDLGADVTGVTLSEEQLAVSRARAMKAGLSERARFALQDYRALAGRFDRIVSVGMFEHVGVPNYRAFFAKCASLLADDGAMLLHTIGRLDGPGASNPWITKYIFPGGYTPALSEVLPAIERSGLYVADIETLRLHYAETLKAWRARFRDHWAEAAAIYDERFCRMWDFYLTAMEVAFRRQHLCVYQIQLARRVDALPITRDYMLEDERSMRFAGMERMPQAAE
ncbi:MAG TPA: cyclopropane-fatty-acyl-phospholipid synthase family protein [Rhizomicrobium sp.]|nr:cyclopropane-fatty-acyl-phospholipid synthase family protein [Rhizomicrobium sp.]